MFLTVLSLNLLGDVAAKRFDIREAVAVSAGVTRRHIVSQRTVDGPLLEVDDLKTHFRTDRGLVRAVDGVSFTLERGKTLGIVGESGSGKSVLSRSIMGLLPDAQRRARRVSVRFEGHEIGGLARSEMREHLGHARWRWSSRTR